MKQGTFELLFFAVTFFLLQVWWISMVIRNGYTKENNDKNEGMLEKKKQQLENLFKK